jgi:hypothetical protein
MPSHSFIALVALLGLIASALGGYAFGVRNTNNAHEAALGRAEKAWTEQYIAKVGEQRRLAAAVGDDLAKTEAQRRADRAAFNRRLADVSRPLITLSCPSQGLDAALVAAPEPGRVADSGAVFTADFSRLWNDALSTGFAGRSGGDSAGADARDPEPGVAAD